MITLIIFFQAIIICVMTFIFFAKEQNKKI
jgi:hypothetical protein